jgi:hypothetical protein
MEELEPILLRWQHPKEEGIAFYHLEDREAGYWIVSSQYERFLGCEIEQAKIEISLFFNFGFMHDLRHLKAREGYTVVNHYDDYFAALDETIRLRELKENSLH